jgi:hypothetical protein
MTRRVRQLRRGARSQVLANSGALGLFLVVTLSIILGGWLIWRHYSAQIRADIKTGCVTAIPAQYQTVFVLDATDPFSVRQRESILGTQPSDNAPDSLEVPLWLKEWNALKPNGRFSAVLITGKLPSSLVEFVNRNEICRLYRDRKEMQSLGIPIDISTAEDSYLEQQYGDFMKDTVTPVFKKLRDAVLSSDSSQDSPILEYLSGISKWRGFDSPNRKLVIVSDMLENSAALPQFAAGRKRFSDFSTTGYGRSLLPSFRGVEVSIYYVMRRKYAADQTDAQQQFWRDYFRASGADMNKYSLTPLADDAPVPHRPAARLFPAAPLQLLSPDYSR